jgi:hypothetical protein
LRAAGSLANGGTRGWIGRLTQPKVLPGGHSMAKGQEKPGKTNKPKVTTKAKQAKKAEKKAAGN